MGKKHLDKFLSDIASQVVLKPDLSLEELVKTHTVLANSEEDRKNKTFIQRTLVLVFAFNNVALFYLIASQASKQLLFLNVKLEITISHYIYLGMLLTYYLLNIIVKYHFPDQRSLIEKFWEKVRSKNSHPTEPTQKIY